MDGSKRGLEASDRGFLAFAAVSGALSVIAGAFAAHGLSPESDAARIGWLHTASEYEALHALAMLAVATLSTLGRVRATWAIVAQWLFVIGDLLFPGALYGLALHGPRLLGAVAPIGGTAYILGWLVFAVAALRRRDS